MSKYQLTKLILKFNKKNKFYLPDPSDKNNKTYVFSNKLGPIIRLIQYIIKGYKYEPNIALDGDKNMYILFEETYIMPLRVLYNEKIQKWYIELNEDGIETNKYIKFFRFIIFNFFKTLTCK